MHSTHHQPRTLIGKLSVDRGGTDGRCDVLQEERSPLALEEEGVHEVNQGVQNLASRRVSLGSKDFRCEPFGLLQRTLLHLAHKVLRQACTQGRTLLPEQQINKRQRGLCQWVHSASFQCQCKSGASQPLRSLSASPGTTRVSKGGREGGREGNCSVLTCHACRQGLAHSAIPTAASTSAAVANATAFALSVHHVARGNTGAVQAPEAVGVPPGTCAGRGSRWWSICQHGNTRCSGPGANHKTGQGVARRDHVLQVEALLPPIQLQYDLASVEALPGRAAQELVVGLYHTLQGSTVQALPSHADVPAPRGHVIWQQHQGCRSGHAGNWETLHRHSECVWKQAQHLVQVRMRETLRVSTRQRRVVRCMCTAT